MRRLYLKLYVAFLGIVVLCAFAVGASWHLFGDDESFRNNFVKGVAERIVLSLPEAKGPELEAELKQTAKSISADLTLYGEDQRLIATSLSAPRAFPNAGKEGFFKTREGGGYLLHLEDGRSFVAHFTRPHSHSQFFLMLALFGGLMALGSYPMARQITRRLENVQKKVEAFGSGDLSARAQVCGKDEVAGLAMSFNAAASKIETLIGQQKRMLASASHELRSPLARVRMAVELMETAEPARRRELAAQVEGDVQELDDLVEDLLLAVRAEAAPSTRERLDLLKLVSEVAAQSSLEAQGTSVEVEVNRRMLRRLVRNLIENARTHGHGKNIEVRVAVHDGKAQIVVDDDGPGVPESERNRIFEPFYRPEGHDETQHGGVGLGLSLVRQIATHHQGLCWVEPREGGGSRFIVELPAV